MLQVKEDQALHHTDKPGVLSLDIYAGDQNLIVTGGADKEAIVFDRKTEKVRRSASHSLKKELWRDTRG